MRSLRDVNKLGITIGQGTESDMELLAEVELSMKRTVKWWWEGGERCAGGRERSSQSVTSHRRLQAVENPKGTFVFWGLRKWEMVLEKPDAAQGWGGDGEAELVHRADSQKHLPWQGGRRRSWKEIRGQWITVLSWEISDNGCVWEEEGRGE